MSNGYKKLWFAVLVQAIKDAEGYVSGPKDYSNLIITEGARAWFLSKNQGIGSFLWICPMLDLNPAFVRSLVAKKYNSTSKEPRILGKSKDKKPISSRKAAKRSSGNT